MIIHHLSFQGLQMLHMLIDDRIPNRVKFVKLLHIDFFKIRNLYMKNTEYFFFVLFDYCETSVYKFMLLKLFDTLGY